jgi:CHASE2 domain-containing sensor protein
MYVLFIGLVAGILDGVSACLLAWVLAKRSPALVFRFVASGVFGTKAFQQRPMPWVGLAFHLGIALAFTAAYFGLCTFWPWPLYHPVAAAIGYGLVVWAIMNRGVVPLSKVPPRPMPFWLAVVNMVILIGAIGLPVAWGARWYFLR